MKRHYLYLLLFNSIILTYLFFNIQFVYACTGTYKRPLTGAPCESAVCGGGTVSGVWQRYIEYSNSPEYYGSCVQLEYFSNSSCSTLGSNPCSASCTSDSECGAGVCASGSQSAASVCSGDRGSTPWWCQGYNCGYQCNASYQCVQAPVGGGVYGPASTCQQFCVYPTSTPTSTPTTSTPTTPPGQPTSTPTPTPTGVPSANWSGSCSGTTFTIGPASNPSTPAVGIYTEGPHTGSDAFNINAPGSATVFSGEKFNWYVGGRNPENLKGNATCRATSSGGTPISYNDCWTSIEGGFKYADDATPNYDGMGLSSSSLPIHIGPLYKGQQSGTQCNLRGYPTGSASPWPLNGTTDVQNSSDMQFQRFGWNKYVYAQYWGTCGYSTLFNLFFWPRFPNNFIVTQQSTAKDGNMSWYQCGDGYIRNSVCSYPQNYYTAGYSTPYLTSIAPFSYWQPGYIQVSDDQMCFGGWYGYITFGIKVPVTLTVRNTGTGTGTISATYQGNAINGIQGCSPSTSSPCTSVGLYKSSATAAVTLTASANAGSVFAGWPNGCNLISGSTCTVNLDSTSKPVIAIFNPAPTPIPTPIPLRVLNVSVTGGGLVTGGEQGGPTIINCTSSPSSPCSASFVNNRTVILVANSINNTSFAGWGGDGSCSGPIRTCLFTMTRDRTVTATFVPRLAPWMKVSGDVHINQ